MRDLLTLAVGLTITAIIAAANMSYGMSLAYGTVFTIPTAYLFAALGLALDGAMILATFAYKEADRPRQVILAVIFIIASAYSVHSLHGFLKTNTNQVATQELLGASYQKELQMRLEDLEKQKKRDYTKIEEIRRQIHPTTPSPVQGYELFLSFALWFLHTFIFYALLTPAPTMSTKKEVAYVEPKPAGLKPNGSKTKASGLAPNGGRPVVGRKPLI
jgi:hypothetical protein